MLINSRKSILNHTNSQKYLEMIFKSLMEMVHGISSKKRKKKKEMYYFTKDGTYSTHTH